MPLEETLLSFEGLGFCDSQRSDRKETLEINNDGNNI